MTRWLFWIAIAMVAFLWGSTVLGVAVRLADQGVDAWWVVLPFGLLPLIGLAIARRSRPTTLEQEPSQSSRSTTPAARAPADIDGASVTDLTPREREVLKLMAEGYTNRQIAQKLYISTATVKSHVNGICRKLLAENRTQAVAIARKLGLLGD